MPADKKMNLCFKIVLLLLVSTIAASCDRELQNDPSIESSERDVSIEKKTIKVDVETANLGYLSAEREYKGTTQPQKQVSWRSQTEGILLELSVEVGDRVQQGQSIGRLDDRILQTEVAGKAGELAALKSELAQAKIRVTDAQIKLEEAEIQLEQANNEAIRYENLAKTGSIAQQQAQSFKTAAKIAEKTLLTAREAVKLEQQAVTIVESRIATQSSAIAESKQRQTYSQITAPIDGIVITKSKDSGSLIRMGEEVLTIGDFSKMKVIVPLSELDLGKVTVGQQVRVKLDAFENRQFLGEVTRIAPTANDSSGQIAVEIKIDNPEREIKGGLLARVNFASTKERRVIVPQTAIVEERGTNYLFTVMQSNEDNRSEVTKRKVIIGDRAQNKVEIVAGISPGEKYVLRSSKPLEDSDSVSLSIISK